MPTVVCGVNCFRKPVVTPVEGNQFAEPTCFHVAAIIFPIEKVQKIREENEAFFLVVEAPKVGIRYLFSWASVFMCARMAPIPFKRCPLSTFCSPN
jgi:hypothetical protein